MAFWFTSFFALFPFLVYSGFSNHISTTLSDPFLISSTQIKFWSENVQNNMPTPILKKLSPLTQKDCDSYVGKIEVGFSAVDSKFCSLAKLSCSTKELEDVTSRGRFIWANSATKVYNHEFGDDHQKNINEDDPFSFFRISMLKNGNSVRLPNLQESLPDRSFLPAQIASKISLNIKHISRLFPESTKETIEKTLSYCNGAAIKGEVKSCPKSLEEMIDFSKSALGGRKRLISLTSKTTRGSNTQLTIKNVKKFDTDKMVACHEVFLPFAAYFCHSLSSTNLYSVDLFEPKTGAPINTLIASCHMDTSPWPENHVAFKILKLRPGQGEACHWFTQIDLAWILDN